MKTPISKPIQKGGGKMHADHKDNDQLMFIHFASLLLMELVLAVLYSVPSMPLYISTSLPGVTV